MNLEKETLSFLGHEKAEAILARSISSGKIFPTWIFCGPSGIGKSTLAKKFAKCLLSENIPDGNFLKCPAENPVHKLVDLRTHPDFFVLEEREESVSIDETRALMARIWKTPAMSKWRVVILENAHDLNKNIYNSLLKVLEEPPKNTVIILICSHTGSVPKTLLSRASIINFRPLKIEQVEKVIREMNIDNAKKLAALSGGSIGHALYLRDNNCIEIYDSILKAFEYSEDGNIYKKTLRYIFENNLNANFKIFKESILRILKIYADILNGIECKNCEDEIKILRTNIDARNISIDDEIKKNLEIIHTINKSEAMMLDKNAIMVYVFERFFRN